MYSSVIGAGLILIGWFLFVYFLLHSPDDGSGYFINIKLPSWFIFAAPFVAVRIGIREGASKGIIFSVILAVTTLLLVLPMILAPVLVPIIVVSASADLASIVRGWASLVTVIVFLLCVIALIANDGLSDFTWAFYFWPISNLIITVGLYLL